MELTPQVVKTFIFWDFNRGKQFRKAVIMIYAAMLQWVKPRKAFQNLILAPREQYGREQRFKEVLALIECRIAVWNNDAIDEIKKLAGREHQLESDYRLNDYLDDSILYLRYAEQLIVYVDRVKIRAHGS